MLWLIGIVAAAILAHTAPFPFLLDTSARTLWRMPQTRPPTIYLTFDDGPNPAATPALLDVLKKHDVSATFFVIDRHITHETVPILRRIFEDGHAVALHSHTRRLMFMNYASVAATLQEAAARIEVLTGYQTCRAFRPHAGHRSIPMLIGASRAGFTVVGWGWMLWDFNWFRARTADATVRRVSRRIGDGDIVVMHDGDESAPLKDQRHTVDATARLIPELRAKGFEFGTVCEAT